MNRFKKEEARRHAEARRGLSSAEIAELDAAEARKAALLDEARSFHVRIFPEEYDHILDDGVDAKMRKYGENPLTASALERARRFRAELGFIEVYADYTRSGSETLDWVVGEVRAGRRGRLEKLARRRNLRQ